jgi:DNA-binding transcriptional LysR family regulator
MLTYRFSLWIAGVTMDMRKLEAFCRVYEQRSFSKAAKVLFLSQPTVSSHISSLEEELGILLFDRLGRSILPTEAAEILYGSAHSVFERLEDAKIRIQLLQDKVVGDLHLGGSTIPATYFLPQIMGAFATAYPDVTFHVEVGDCKSITDRVVCGELLLGVVGAQPHAPELESELVLEDDVVLVAHADLARRLSGHAVSIRDLSQLPWIIRGKGSGTREAFECAVEPFGILPHMDVRACVDNTATAMECVLAGMGVTVTSKTVARRYRGRSGLVVLDVPDLVLKREFYLTYRKDRRLFPAAEAFMRFFREHGADLLAEDT